MESRDVTFGQMWKSVDSHEENVNCIDTTGAGDSFGMGFLNALLDGNGVKRCAKEGNRYGAEAVQHIGATAWLNGGL